MELTYHVHSVDTVEVQRDVVVDGQTVQAKMPGLSVQLTSPQGTIFLNLSSVPDPNPFEPDTDITVTFGGRN